VVPLRHRPCTTAWLLQRRETSSERRELRGEASLPASSRCLSRPTSLFPTAACRRLSCTSSAHVLNALESDLFSTRLAHRLSSSRTLRCFCNPELHVENALWSDRCFILPAMDRRIASC
jgi:hypothetical protein